MNLSCAICTELLCALNEADVTICGHIFHHNCLYKWLERSKTCPQCRHRCHERHVHRVYFNVANFDTSRIDAGVLQQQLDNLKLQTQLTENDLQKAKNEINELKDVIKTKTEMYTALQKKLEQKNFLILSFNEQIKFLKEKNKDFDDCRKEKEQLKNKIELMRSMETIIVSSSSEVEKLVKEVADPNKLALFCVALKRELRISENKKNDIRDSLKSVQNDLRKERELRHSLEEKMVQLESENYRLSEKIKTLEQQKENAQLAKNSEDNILAKSTPPKEFNNFWTNPKVSSSSASTESSPLKEEFNKFWTNPQVSSSSASISEKVKKIEESDSPYLNIKQSAFGLTPLMKLGSRKYRDKTEDEVTTKNQLKDLSTEYTIFKRRRLLCNQIENRNLAFNGLGGSEKVQTTHNNVDHISDRFKKDQRPKSISDRIKSGKLKKIPSTGNILN